MMDMMNQSSSYHLPPSHFEENPRLIKALGCLWAVLLPHAASASIESRSWKALSSLAFGTRSADRLWVAAMRSCRNENSLQGSTKLSKKEKKAATVPVTTEVNKSSSFSMSRLGLGLGLVLVSLCIYKLHNNCMTDINKS
jgi:hypothetical protein